MFDLKGRLEISRVQPRRGGAREFICRVPLDLTHPIPHIPGSVYL